MYEERFVEHHNQGCIEHIIYVYNGVSCSWAVLNMLYTVYQHFVCLMVMFYFTFFFSRIADFVQNQNSIDVIS